MSLVLLDVLCALLVALGVAMVLKSQAKPLNGSTLQLEHANDNPQTYILRIAGTMIAVFGFFLGAMATGVHLSGVSN